MGPSRPGGRPGCGSRARKCTQESWDGEGREVHSTGLARGESGVVARPLYLGARPRGGPWLAGVAGPQGGDHWRPEPGADTTPPHSRFVLIPGRPHAIAAARPRPHPPPSSRDTKHKLGCVSARTGRGPGTLWWRSSTTRERVHWLLAGYTTSILVASSHPRDEAAAACIYRRRRMQLPRPGVTHVTGHPASASYVVGIAGSRSPPGRRTRGPVPCGAPGQAPPRGCRKPPRSGAPRGAHELVLHPWWFRPRHGWT